MLWFKKTRLEFAICAISTLTACGSFLAPSVGARSNQQAASPSAVEKQVGAIKSIEGTTVTITTDSGSSAAVSVQPTTKIVRVAPGQTDLKTAVPVELKDLQVGDRVFVRWKASDTAQPVPALGIIVMKRADVDAKQEHDREDWQKRSVGGLVSSADAGPSSLDQIKPGDQLRALGTRNAEGSAMEAEEIVTGSFRNIAGTITSMDAASNSVTVMDLLTKKTVVVKLSSQSQLRKLSPEVAQRIAFRLKAAAAGTPQTGNTTAAPGSAPSSGNRPADGAPAASASQETRQPGGASNPGAGNGRPGGGQVDLQQILSRMPAAPLTDFQKGDAGMVVSTDSGSSGGLAAIRLLGGVEPILAPAPSASQAMTLSPWSLGSSAADAAGANP